MATGIEDDLQVQFTKEMHEYVQTYSADITFNVNFMEAWCLLCQLQIASRHPENKGETSVIAREIIEQVFNALPLGPAIREVIRRGWDSNYDQPRSKPN